MELLVALASAHRVLACCACRLELCAKSSSVRVNATTPEASGCSFEFGERLGTCARSTSMSPGFESPVGHDAEERGAAVRLTDDDGPGYMYAKLAERLAARITSGEFRPNRRLPPELGMVAEYGVSLGTARHAIRLLRKRGLVITVRSKGTFVVDRIQRQKAKNPTSRGGKCPGISIDGIVRGSPDRVLISPVEEGGDRYLGVFAGKEAEPLLLVDLAAVMDGMQEISAW
jgi:GntR family transcriptional regulator